MKQILILFGLATTLICGSAHAQNENDNELERDSLQTENTLPKYSIDFLTELKEDLTNFISDNIYEYNANEYLSIATEEFVNCQKITGRQEEQEYEKLKLRYLTKTYTTKNSADSLIEEIADFIPYIESDIKQAGSAKVKIVEPAPKELKIRPLKHRR